MFHKLMLHFFDLESKTKNYYLTLVIGMFVIFTVGIFVSFAASHGLNGLIGEYEFFLLFISMLFLALILSISFTEDNQEIKAKNRTFQVIYSLVLMILITVFIIMQSAKTEVEYQILNISEVNLINNYDNLKKKGMSKISVKLDNEEELTDIPEDKINIYVAWKKGHLMKTSDGKLYPGININEKKEFLYSPDCLTIAKTKIKRWYGWEDRGYTILIHNKEKTELEGNARDDCQYKLKEVM